MRVCFGLLGHFNAECLLGAGRAAGAGGAAAPASEPLLLLSAPMMPTPPSSPSALLYSIFGGTGRMSCFHSLARLPALAPEPTTLRLLASQRDTDIRRGSCRASSAHAPPPHLPQARGAPNSQSNRHQILSSKPSLCLPAAGPRQPLSSAAGCWPLHSRMQRLMTALLGQPPSPNPAAAVQAARSARLICPQAIRKRLRSRPSCRSRTWQQTAAVRLRQVATTGRLQRAWTEATHQALVAAAAMAAKTPSALRQQHSRLSCLPATLARS